MSSDEQVRRLAALDSCGVSDALDALGLEGGVLDGIGPCWERARLAGRAYTMAMEKGPLDSGSPPVHLGARAVARASTGDVIVIANGARTSMGSWGGLLTRGAIAAGVQGVVTDGACRDVDEIREWNFPVFARAATARTARGRAHEVSCGEPIVINGITVRTGDLILADASAAVVVPRESAEAVLTKAEELAAAEAALVESIAAGSTLTEVLDAKYEHLLEQERGANA